MIGKLGTAGIVGLLLMLLGIAAVAYENLVVAAGLALLVAGIGLVVYGLLTSLMSQMGLGGAL